MGGCECESVWVGWATVTHIKGNDNINIKFRQKFITSSYTYVLSEEFNNKISIL